MREIKFRAWDGKKMYSWDSVDHPFVDEITGTPELKLFYLPMSYLVGDSNDMVWMQYTGLKDKNGKEIYEGDCLGGVWESLYIKFCDKRGGYELSSKEFGCMACVGDVHWYELVQETPEIIGNIYENPELISNK